MWVKFIEFPVSEKPLKLPGGTRGLNSSQILLYEASIKILPPTEGTVADAHTAERWF